MPDKQGGVCWRYHNRSQHGKPLAWAFAGFYRNDEWDMRLREAGCRVIIEDLLELIDLLKDGID